MKAVEKGFTPLEIPRIESLLSNRDKNFQHQKFLTGFTLIELMVVIAIVAIVASIAVPSLLNAKKNANELAAQKVMSNTAQIEALWYKQDTDRNGQHDYYVYDFSGLYYARGVSGAASAFEDIGCANADSGVLINWDTLSTISNGGTALTAAVPRTGYLFGVIANDPSGVAYRTQAVGNTTLGSDTITASTTTTCNLTEFAFCAYPSSYNGTGIRQFIVDESGLVSQKDTGNGTIQSQWPVASGISVSSAGWALATD